jgi:membrane protease subunit (stomatin/prohibitin family)
MQSQRIGIKSISAYLEPLSQALKSSMLAFWEDYGFNLEGFYITSVEIDSSSVEGQRILEAIARQSAQLIGGYSWQQAKAFEVAENAVNSAGKGGMLGALMMTSMMGTGAGAVGVMLQPSPGGVPASGASGQIGSGVAPVPHEVFCSNCSKKYSSVSKFCPHCGDPYLPCPHCGTDNDKAARRCVSCGTPLASSASCPTCGMQLPPGASICPRCVRGVGRAAKCAQCGSLLAPEDGFCSECGKKVE